MKRTCSLLLVVSFAVVVVTPGNAFSGPGQTQKALITAEDAEVDAGQVGSNGSRNRVIPGPMSANGRITAWVSDQSDIVPGDTNGERDIFARDLLTGETMIVSLADDGTPANDGSSDPAPSGDGRYIAFKSAATNLIPGDPAPVGGVFVHDLVTGTNDRISVSSTGEQANKPVFDAVPSHDGRFVVFETTATNLDPRDTNLYPDIYVHDRMTGTTKVVSVDSEGNVQDGGALFPDISPDGRYVAFQSYAPLVPIDTNGRQDIYVHDTETGKTEIASVSNDGVVGDQDSRTASISEGGRYVTFSSTAATLVPQDTNGAADIFVRDLVSDRTRRITVTSSGAEAQSGGTAFTPGSHFPSISPEGRFVAYQSDAPNLMPDDTSDWDVFVHDLVTGSTTLGVRGLDEAVPDMGAGTPELGSDGRYLTFISGSKNLVPEETAWFAMYVRDRGPSAGVGALSATAAGDTITAQGWATFSGDLVAAEQDPADDAGEPGRALGSELTGASFSVRPELEDVFVRWEVAHLPSARSVVAGAPGVVHAAAFEVGEVRYEIRAARVGATGVPPRAPSFGLYRCDPTCTETQQLQGGYGESGMEITTSVDLAALGLDEPSAVMKGVAAFSGPGEAAAGVLHRLDEVALGDIAVPEIEITTAVAMAGTDPGDVVFEEPADFSDGRFTSDLSVRDLAPGEYDVWARGCLGQRCGVASAPVTLGGGPTPTPSTSPTGTPTPEPTGSPQPATTTVSFTDRSRTAGQFSDESMFEARLTDTEGNPVLGAELAFELTGEESSRRFTAVTDAEGVAAVTPALQERPGAYQLTVRYAGDDAHLGSADINLFVVDKEDTDLELSTRGQGNDRSLRARLFDPDAPSSGIAGRTIDFYSDSSLIGTSQTDQDGIATVPVPPGHRGANRDYEAVFAGDDFYLPARRLARGN